MARIDYDRVAAGFREGRSMSPEALEAWRDALTPYVSSGARVLDLGAGTGVFARAIAQWFNAAVVGVEPSPAMIREAMLEPRADGISYLSSDAEHIPLRDASCDAAWLSTVIHHIPHLPACAAELRRVLVPGAPVLIRSAFPGRLDGVTLFRKFPSAARVVSTFPSVDQTIDAFAPAGFAFDHIESVPQVSAPSLSSFLERVRLRADTTLLLMPDDEFAAGLAALEREAAAETAPQPIIDRLDLLVLWRT